MNSIIQEITHAMQMNGGDLYKAMDEAAVRHGFIADKQQLAFAFQRGTGNPILSNPYFWPRYSDSDSDIGYTDIDIVNDSLIGEMAKSVANAVQFPVNTAFLHGLGCVASAMTWRFKLLEYGKEKPATLYVVTAQPPSTGKSAVNDYFTDPITDYGLEINQKREKARIALEAELLEIVGSIKAAEKNGNADRARKLKEDALEIQEGIAANSRIKWMVTDGTSEGLEQVAFQQEGMVNIVSDEADAINVVLGAAYQKEGGKQNHGMVLKMWDGGHHSSVRITREGGEGRVRGSISVIAQDDGVKSIIQAGESGRGISERILMLRERNLLGKRKHKGAGKRRVDAKILADYNQMIINVLSEEEPVVLEISESSDDMIADYRDQYEGELSDDGSFSASMIRGAFGKCDKQIRRIACVLHVSSEWQKKGKRSTLVTDDTIAEAMRIYHQLFLAYIKAMESQGAAGDDALAEAAKEKLKAFVEKKRRSEISLREFRDFVRKSKPFSQYSMITSVLRDRVLPELVRQAAIATYGDDIYVSPWLAK